MEARKRFGIPRVFDTPLSENTLTGIGVGAAICGMRPVLVHARNDFLLLTMDQIVNHAAKWKYMAGGKLSVPFLIRAIIGRGWGQAAQHSQSLQALFAHVPGLQVIMPSSPYDAKGLILESLQNDLTTVCIEHRWLYDKSGPVPEEFYTIPMGKGNLVKKGKDVTVVAISHMVLEAKTAALECEQEKIDLEIIDPRSLRPLDEDLICQSVKKTGRLIVADTGWKRCGLSAEIAALVAENCLRDLKQPVVRITLADTPTPCSSVLENAYYPTAKNIVHAAKNLVHGNSGAKDEVVASQKTEKEFSGPF
ncbi:MAG: alpha-ketoacid dehydrogenase subunit beta [Elusimicrobia bacterium]|nr:alpha-ketoacid dehydrogenase subunit beta [Elusimicrobiota bacterium]